MGKCGPTGIYFKEQSNHKSCLDCKYQNSADDTCMLFTKESSWYARSTEGHCGPDGFFFSNDKTGNYVRSHHHIIDQ